MDIKIDYLKHHPQYISEIAGYFLEEWGYLYPERSLKDFEDSISERMSLDKYPLALVAIYEGSFIGTISLKEYDMETRKDLSPWLASLYVKKEFRGKGVGKSLINALINTSKELGINKLYLYTPSAEEYYKGLNWTIIDKVNYYGKSTTIMEKEI